MALIHSPNIPKSGLVALYDGANIRSFRGPVQTNILNQISYGYSNQSSSTFRVTNGEETVNIPTVGIRTVKYVDIYNDYNGGSGNCCLSLFSFGDVSTGVTGNTTYTYSILYKTTTGYTHPNYMYRYEYNGGSYVTEQGIHNTSNRTDLGGGWYHAWGTFTTQASTNRLLCYLFHYEYATQNRVYVAAVQITQGSYIGIPQHMLTSGQTRGTTNATGGGWVDLSGNGNHGELVNGPSHNSDTGGSIVFDGTNDYINLGNVGTIGNYQTIDVWFYSTSVTNYRNILDMNYANYGSTGNVGPRLEQSTGGATGWVWSGNTSNNSLAIGQSVSYNISANTWYNATWVNDNGTVAVYLNGVATQTGISSTYGFITTYGAASIGRGFHLDSSRYFAGRVGTVKIYSKVLSATEILQNFNATRDRYGV